MEERRRRVESAVDIERGDQRLVGIRKQRLLEAAAALLFAAPEEQMLAEVEPLRVARQRLRRHDRRLDLRLLPLVVSGKLPEQHVGDDEPEDCVAEKFERLVVVYAPGQVL